MWGIIRIGRYAAMSGGGRRQPRKPPGPNAQAGWAIVILAVLAVTGVKVPWFGITMLSLSAVSMTFVLCSVAGQKAKRQQAGRDKLGDLMDDYRKEAKS